MRVSMQFSSVQIEDPVFIAVSVIEKLLCMVSFVPVKAF
jgi:hypothetical protein